MGADGWRRRKAGERWRDTETLTETETETDGQDGRANASSPPRVGSVATSEAKPQAF